MVSEKEILIRLIVACLLGGLIGWEREFHDRPAGFRTHILVSVGSTLIMLVSLGLYYSFINSADPGRIAAQVVSGIGFLGAGTIIRQGVNVKGLTTAASLWTTAGIGLACGLGMYYSAFIATGLVFIVLMFLNKLEFRFSRKDAVKTIEIRAIDRPGLLGDLGQILGDHSLNILKITMDQNSEDEFLRVHFQISLPGEVDYTFLSEKIYQVSGVSFVKWNFDQHKQKKFKLKR